MRVINPEIDLWLSKNADVPTRTDMKTVIMESVRYKVEENKDVDVEDILSILPLKHKRRFMQPLCLASLKKVSSSAYVYKHACFRSRNYLQEIITENSQLLFLGANASKYG